MWEVHWRCSQHQHLQGVKEACLGTERSWASLQTQQEPQPIPQGALEPAATPIGATGRGFYRPPLTIHWIQAAPWASCFFSAKSNPRGAIHDMGVILSPQLSAVSPLSHCGGGGPGNTPQHLLHQFCSHEKMCKSPSSPKIEMYSTHFAHLKC